MASNTDRKRRILEHLNKSSDTLKLTPLKSALKTEIEEVPPVTPDRVPELISEHLIGNKIVKSKVIGRYPLTTSSPNSWSDFVTRLGWAIEVTL